MTTMRSPVYIAALALVLCSPVAQGYLEPTHQLITGAAVSRSVLQTNPAVLQDMGLSLSSTFPNTKGAPGTIPELLSDGADFEDSLLGPPLFNVTLRPLRHFYNPVTGLGLNIPLLPNLDNPLQPTQTSSPDWALARPGAISAQQNSYWNARQSLFDALTKPAEVERQAAFGETFQFLGQVVHHLQDMAQPQHVRNEAHPPTNPSLYERWTNDNRSEERRVG